MQLFYCSTLSDDNYYLNPVESNHCVKVLRKQEGDTIHLIDGIGSFYEAKISIASSKKVGFKILKSWKEKKRNYNLHIAIAPTKNIDRMKWFVEKATEVGVDEITPIICEKSERRILNNDRLEKVILSACKQSIKAKIPILNQAVKFDAFISSLDLIESDAYIAHCFDGEKILCSKISSKKSIIIIGPEGDFTPDELDKSKSQGIVPISFGSSRLRTETAGIIAATTLAIANE